MLSIVKRDISVSAVMQSTNIFYIKNELYCKYIKIFLHCSLIHTNNTDLFLRLLAAAVTNTI